MASGAVTLPLLEKIGRDSRRDQLRHRERRLLLRRHRGRGPAEGRRQARARPPEGVQGRQGRLELRRDRHRRRRLRRRRSRILRDAGYDGPYSVEIEFSGEPWPPLAEVNAAMRGSREHLASGSACDEALHAGDDEPPGARVPGGRRPHGPRPGRLDGGPRRPRAALDGRLHPARGVQAGGRGARRARRAAGPVRPGARPPRCERDHLRPARDVRRAAARHLRLARRGRLRADRARQRPLRQHDGDAVRGRRDVRRPAARRARLPVRVLAGAPPGAGRGVPLGKRGPARERRRDLGGAGDRPRPLRHGARPRLRAGARRVHEPPARAARPRLPLDARLVLGAARGGRRCLGQSERVDGREGRAVPPVGRASVVNLVRDMETMHDRIAPGYDRFRQPRA